MPNERELDRDEISELTSYERQAHSLLPADFIDVEPKEVVGAIKIAIQTLRARKMTHDEVTDVAFALGYLYGEQLRKKFGWNWRYVTQDNGFESYGVISADKAFVCFSIKSVYELLLDPQKDNASLLLFNMIDGGNIPEPEPGRLQSLGF